MSFTITGTEDGKQKTISSTRTKCGYTQYSTFYGLATGGGIIRFGKTTSTIYRGFAEFDVSDIPDSAEISGIVLSYQGYEHNSDARVKEITTEQPTASGAIAATVYGEINSSTTYADVAGFPVVGNNQIITLGSSDTDDACVDLTNQLDDDWYALGFLSESEGSSDSANIIYSADSATPLPTIIVTYDGTSSSVSLSTPRSIQRGYSRNIERYSFRSGSFARTDIGSGGKTITMNGTELSDATTNFDMLDALMESGEPITTTGLSYDSLNSNWYIGDFDWHQNEAYVNRYDWKLVLLETN